MKPSPKLSSLRFPVPLPGSSRQQHRGAPGPTTLPQMRALGVLLVSCLESFKPVAWYAAPLTEHDLRKFKVSVGSSKHNTTWEDLALLVAVRLWLPRTRVLARVRCNSLSALKSMVRLYSNSADLNVTAWELASDAVSGLDTVGLATHIRGVSDRLPDDLSRMWALQPHLLPLPLERVPRQPAPDRDRWFWKTTVAKRRRGAQARKLTSSGR